MCQGTRQKQETSDVCERFCRLDPMCMSERHFLRLRAVLISVAHCIDRVGSGDAIIVVEQCDSLLLARM